MDSQLRDELLRVSTTAIVNADRLHAARTLAIFDLADAIRNAEGKVTVEEFGLMVEAGIRQNIDEGHHEGDDR